MAADAPSILSLPNELLAQVLTYLAQNELFQTCLVNRLWSYMAKEQLYKCIVIRRTAQSRAVLLRLARSSEDAALVKQLRFAIQPHKEEEIERGGGEEDIRLLALLPNLELFCLHTPYLESAASLNFFQAARAGAYLTNLREIVLHYWDPFDYTASPFAGLLHVLLIPSLERLSVRSQQLPDFESENWELPTGTPTPSTPLALELHDCDFVSMEVLKTLLSTRPVQSFTFYQDYSVRGPNSHKYPALDLTSIARALQGNGDAVKVLSLRLAAGHYETDVDDSPLIQTLPSLRRLTCVLDDVLRVTKNGRPLVMAQVLPKGLEELSLMFDVIPAYASIYYNRLEGFLQSRDDSGPVLRTLNLWMSRKVRKPPRSLYELCQSKGIKLRLDQSGCLCRACQSWCNLHPDPRS